MKKIMSLVGVQLWALLGSMFSLGESRKKPKALYAGVILLVIILGSVAFLYCYMIGRGLMMFNSINILPPMVMAVTCVFVLLTTIFKVKGTIFGFRDYDMVMSLPVKTSSVVASRLILLYLMNFIFVLMIMIPMMAAYGILARPNVLFYVNGSISMFFIPLVPIIAASFLGTFITYVASKFRHSSIMNIIFSLLLVVGIMALSFSLGRPGEELVNISRALTDQVNSIYPLAGMYTKAVCGLDYASLAYFILISVVAFLVFSYLIGIVFKKINTVVMTGRYKTHYKMAELKTSTPLKALYIKELKRFFSSPLYVLNTGIGVLMMTAGAIALFFVDLNKLAQQMQASVIFQSGPVFASFCILMCCTSASSISLEGRNLWIIKSLPVSAGTIFASKLLVNMSIAAPMVIDAVLLSIALKLSLVEGLFTVLVAVACIFFTSFLGLLMNLVFPRFDWTSEVVVIKQSAATMITIFSGFGLIALQILILYLLKNFIISYLIFTLLVFVIDFILYKGITGYGAKRFKTL